MRLDERSRLATRRKILLTIAIVVVVGSLSTTLGYALRMRSQGYRIQLEQRLSERLRMHARIGRVEPLSFRSKRLHDITLRSTRRDVDVFHCDLADWRGELRDGIRSYSIDLYDGWLLVGAHGWSPSDYREMLTSGLGHDFSALRIREVSLTSIDLRWRHPGFELRADRASGTLTFDEDGEGRASLEAASINGIPVDAPIRIMARFRPGRRLAFHEIMVTAPEAPLSALGLEEILGGKVSQGRFAGNIQFRRREGVPVVRVDGAITHALLEELTRQVDGGPYIGQVDVTVDAASFTNQTLQALKFSGQLTGVEVNPIAAILNAPAIGGVVDLRVHQAVYEDGKLIHLSAEGSVRDVELSAVTDLIGGGRISGKFSAKIHALQVVDDRVVHAHVTLKAIPPDGQTGTIDRELLSRLSAQMLGFDATTIVPSFVQELEYTHLGVVLELNGRTLRIRGTHGPSNDTILTLKMLGRDMGIIKAPERTYQVEDPLSFLRQKVEEVDPEEAKQWWQSRRHHPVDRQHD